jgi:hypothetical protein
LREEAVFGFDASEVIMESAEAEKKAKSSMASVVSHMRRMGQFGIALATATGKGLNQMYTMMIEAALVTIDTIYQTQAAIALGTFGVGTMFQIAMSATSVLMMIATIDALRRGKTEAARETSGMIQMFRIISITR